MSTDPPELTRFQRMVEAALWLAQQGAYISHAPVHMAKSAKVHWKDTKSRDPAVIRSFLSGGAVNALVIAADRMLVVDDDKFGWHDRLVAAGMPETFTVTTPTKQDKDGHVYDRHHHYLKVPVGFDVTRLPGVFAGGELRRSLDGEQGMVLGPYAIRGANGATKTYEVTARQPIAEAPESFLQFLIDNSGSGSGSITMVEGRHWQWGDRDRGSRHNHLNGVIRGWRGKLPNRDALIAQTWLYIEEHGIPLERVGDEDLNRAEVERMVDGALRKFDDDTPEQRTEWDEQQRQPASAPDDDLIELDDEGAFPDPPEERAFEGRVGELVALTVGHTTADPAGLLATTLSMLGVICAAQTEYHGLHPSVLAVSLVGATGVGKDTAIDLIERLVGTSRELGAARVRRSGFGSGEVIVRALSKRQQAGEDPLRMLAIENELGALLKRSKREGATLSETLRSLWDGRSIETNSVTGGEHPVDPPYWFGTVAGITPTDLRSLLDGDALSNGAANRWLWVPVREQPVPADGLTPVVPQSLRDAIQQAEKRRGVSLTVQPKAADGLAAYRDFLRTTPSPRGMSTRLHVMALRIALIHAALDGASEVGWQHVNRGTALTEYVRRGWVWTFGHMTGNADGDLLLRHLYERGSLSGRQVWRLLRDPVRRLAATDAVQRMGYGELVERSGTQGGRPTKTLVLRNGEGRLGHLGTLGTQTHSPTSGDTSAFLSQTASVSTNKHEPNLFPTPTQPMPIPSPTEGRSVGERMADIFGTDHAEETT